jgi:hypothetical protein
MEKMDPDPFKSERQDPDPYQKGVNPQHCMKSEPPVVIIFSAFVFILYL